MDTSEANKFMATANQTEVMTPESVAAKQATAFATRNTATYTLDIHQAVKDGVDYQQIKRALAYSLSHCELIKITTIDQYGEVHNVLTRGKHLRPSSVEKTYAIELAKFEVKLAAAKGSAQREHVKAGETPPKPTDLLYKYSTFGLGDQSSQMTVFLVENLPLGRLDAHGNVIKNTDSFLPKNVTTQQVSSPKRMAIVKYHHLVKEAGVLFKNHIKAEFKAVKKFHAALEKSEAEAAALAQEAADKAEHEANVAAELAKENADKAEHEALAAAEERKADLANRFGTE